MFQLINEKEMTETLNHNKSVDLGISISADITERTNQTFSALCWKNTPWSIQSGQKVETESAQTSGSMYYIQMTEKHAELSHEYTINKIQIVGYV